MATCVLLKAVYVSFLAGLLQLDVHATDSDSRIHNDDDAFIANTTYGLVKGKNWMNPYGEVIQYLGIPYAKPPVGDLRFRPPSPPDTWAENLDATSHRSVCSQRNFFDHRINNLGSEDCLYLNVHVPKAHLASGVPLSVIVLIQGSIYAMGSGSDYDDSGLAAKGVIVVSFNYRLDIFGFLSLEDGVIPGNFGMLDQVFVLQWVQSNIAAFGGDPTKVTLMGVGSGATSVSLHLLSPLSDRLFARAIIQSGSSLSPWAFTHPATSPSPKLVARLIGHRVGCTQGDSEDFLECLRKIDRITLSNANTDIQNIIKSNHGVMLPVVESTFGFLPDLPIKLINAGKFHKVDTLRGFNADETAFAFAEGFSTMTLRQFREAIMGTLTSFLLGSLKSFAIPNKDLFVENTFETYKVSHMSTPEYIRDQTIQATSDLAFAGPIMNEIGMFVAKSNVSNSESSINSHYLYRFNYRPSFSTMPPWVRIANGQDIALVFGVESFSHPYVPSTTEMDKSMSHQTMNLWSNFAKTGNPNSVETLKHSDEWKPYTTTNDCLLEIDSNSSMVTYGRPEVIRLSLKLTHTIDGAADYGSSTIG